MLNISSPPFLSSTAQKSVSLFDAKTLEGWQPVHAAMLKYWSVVDGVITASSRKKKMPANTYLATTGNYQNVELNCKFQIYLTTRLNQTKIGINAL